jgi:subtilisin family serine protease
MNHATRLGTLVAVLLMGCDAPREPVAPATAVPDVALALGGQPALKIGTDVLQALQRGETPAVMVALDARAPGNDLAQLRSAVASAQNGALQGVRDDEFRVKRRFVAVPAVAGVARSAAALQRIAAHPQVRRIDLDGGGTGSLVNSVPVINGDDRHTRGNRGDGVVVAILDTGIDTDHPDLSDALVHEACFGDNNSSIDGSGFCPNGSDRQTGAGAAEDDAGHGTHVSGIVASNGTVSGTGMAPDADIVSIKVLDNCSFAGCFQAVSEIVAGLDYLISNPQLGVQVINMSLGTNALYTGDCDNTSATTMSVAAAVNTLRTNGVITFASSGNNGSSTQMTLPACVANVMSVGATDNTDALGNFSNINASTDILAPGVSIVSDARGGGTTTASGTSMASPHAAGCAALLIEAGDATTPATIETRLETSSVSVTDTRNSVTLPRIDCTPVNQAPAVAADNATVTVNEGSQASNTGTFSDGDGDAVTLVASIGTLVPGSGTWSWSFGTTDGPAESQTVTVTATDAIGASTSTTFALVVQNVAPVVSAGADASIVSNQTYNLSGTFTDPGVVDNPWSWSIDWGTGSPTTGSIATQPGPITGSRQYCAAGNYTIALSVTDKDGDTGQDALTLTVTYLPVTIDITPTKHPNSVNIGQTGMLPLAVLGSATFDATTVNPATVVLGDESGTDTPVAQRNNGRYFAAFEDVNGDGRLDLVLQFRVPALVANSDLTLTTTSLVLRGFLGNGCTNFRGTDAIRVVP